MDGIRLSWEFSWLWDYFIMKTADWQWGAGIFNLELILG